MNRRIDRFILWMNQNKVLFVFSYNDASKIDKILLDRMEKIEVKPYTIADKLIITNNLLDKLIIIAHLCLTIATNK